MKGFSTLWFLSQTYTANSKSFCSNLRFNIWYITVWDSPMHFAMYGTDESMHILRNTSSRRLTAFRKLRPVRTSRLPCFFNYYFITVTASTKLWLASTLSIIFPRGFSVVRSKFESRLDFGSIELDRYGRRLQLIGLTQRGVSQRFDQCTLSLWRLFVFGIAHYSSSLLLNLNCGYLVAWGVAHS